MTVPDNPEGGRGLVLQRGNVYASLGLVLSLAAVPEWRSPLDGVAFHSVLVVIVVQLALLQAFWDGGDFMNVSAASRVRWDASESR